jgi:hypothetical protein
MAVPEPARARRNPMAMDLRVYMLLLALLIAIFAIIGYLVVSASFRSHDRRRHALENNLRMRQHWDADSPDSFGHG